MKWGYKNGYYIISPANNIQFRGYFKLILPISKLV